jgi:hypothetical protein
MLAPHLPTQEPQLKASTYDMVLSSALLHPAGKRFGCFAPCCFLSWCQGVALFPAVDPCKLQLGVCSLIGCWDGAHFWLVASQSGCVHLPADHAVLLRLVKAWPPHIYGVEQLQSAMLQ